MSKSRHKRDDGAVANRFAKLAALKAELAKKSAVDESDPRVEAAAFAAMALDNGKAAILHGQPISIDGWRALYEALLALFPPKPKQLVVEFVEGMICRECRASVSAEEAALKAEAKARAGTETEAVPVISYTMDDPKVVPLKGPPPGAVKAKACASTAVEAIVGHGCRSEPTTQC